jgi:hypothetical protein
MFVKNKKVCPWQAVLAKPNVCGVRVNQRIHFLLNVIGSPLSACFLLPRLLALPT